jgi:hypothetical protein
VKKNFRFAVFVVLAIFVIVALERTTMQFLDREHQLSSAKMLIPEVAKIKQRKQKMQPVQKSWVIPTYPIGDLPIIKTKEKKPPLKLSKKKTKKTKHAVKKKMPDTPKRVSPKRDGDFPTLEVGYEAIGFSDYLNAIERVGHFFLISNTRTGTKISSEISLKSQTVYRHKIDLTTLAVKRPHLVSDNMIKERLSAFSLPEDVQTDSIILVFSKPFDDLLWDTIEEALSKMKLSLSEVSRIDGGYVKVREDVFLLIRSAINRKTGERVLLNQRLRISLG